MNKLNSLDKILNANESYVLGYMDSNLPAF